MDSKDIDINAEYERIFGTVPKKLLFDEEEYALLRQEVDQANVTPPPSLIESIELSKKMKTEYRIPITIAQHRKQIKVNLPFSGIDVVPYRVYVFNNKIVPQKQQYRNLFYVKSVGAGGQIVAQAAAYYVVQTDRFTVVKGSWFKENSYSKSLIDYNKDILLGAFEIDKGVNYAIKDFVLDSAALAASIFLGKRADSSEWVCQTGQDLIMTYSRFRSPDTLENEKRFFPGYVPKVNTAQTSVSDILGLIKNTIRKRATVVASNLQETKHHLFFIKDGDCDASGYYNTEDNYFYVCEGSKVDVVGEVDDKRERFLTSACRLSDSQYVVIKDAKCRNAAAAAYYVTGKKVTHTAWRDERNRYLTNYYSREIIVAEGNQDVLEEFVWRRHQFHIKLGDKGNYIATGVYNPDDRTFTLFSGSFLSDQVAPGFYYGKYGKTREKIIDEECDYSDGHYCLNKKRKCLTPSMAAAIVLGREVNGNQFWVDDDNINLESMAKRQGIKL